MASKLFIVCSNLKTQNHIKLAESAIQYSYCLMEAKKKSELKVRKDKYPHSKHHFFFNANSKDYLLFIDETKGFLVKMEQGKSQLQGEFSSEPTIPIHIISTGAGDINILHQNGIYMQYVQQLARNKPFMKIDFKIKISPKKIIKTNENSYIVVSSEQKLIFLQDGKIVKEVSYPLQMKMQSLEIDNHRRQHFEARLVVPHRRNLFPFVFSVIDLLQWSKDNYFQDRLKKYHSSQDEQPLDQDFKMCFSSFQNRIYLYTKEYLTIFNTKYQQVEGMDYVAQKYFKYKTGFRQIPMFVSASHATNTIIVINNSRFAEIIPDKLDKSNTNICVRQKMKDNQLMSCGYGLTNQTCLFLYFGPQNTRFYLI